MSPITYEVQRGIAIIHLKNLPGNGLSHALRLGLLGGLDRALDDSQVVAIVVTGSERVFSVGADVREFGTPKSVQAPLLGSVIEALEESEKPVIAAIQGACLGGGLELAMGAHYRIAKANARLALPEVKLGLLPGAGGTQRLPRAVGLKKALDMIVSGATMMAEKLKDTGLLDRVVSDNLLEAAVDYALELVEAQAPLKQLCAQAVSVEGDAQAILAETRVKLAAANKFQSASITCVDAVAASVELDFEEGMKKERELFLKLVNSPESQAVRYIFDAERAALKLPDIPANTPLRSINKVAVIGAGTMGGGISMNFLNIGIPVTLLDMEQEGLERGLATIRSDYEGAVKRGTLTAKQLEDRMGLLSTTLSYDDLADADLIIEAVFEDMGVKEAVFTELDRVAKPGAILASNTSRLDVDQIASFTKRPQDVIGLHFFSPANMMKLLEIVRGKQTGADVLTTSMQLGIRIGKKPVVSGVCDGFISNRMFYAYKAAADSLILAGASPSQIDQALEQFGFAMGPYRLADYPSSKGVGSRIITNKEIVKRCVYALVNEGAKILDEGIALRSSDIDLVCVYGYGFPRHHGGPMNYAQQVGLFNVVRDIKRFAKTSETVGDFRGVSPLLDRAVENGDFIAL